MAIELHNIQLIKILIMVIHQQNRKLLDVDSTESNYGIKLIYDQVDTALADMCLSINKKAHSVY